MKQTKEQLAEKYRKTTPNQMYGDELGFLAGFSAHEKETVKVLKDLRNKYSSHLVELKQPKLDKVLNKEKINELEIRIDTLNILLK